MQDFLDALRKPRLMHGYLGIIADLAGLGIVAPLLPFHVPPEWVGIILTGQYGAQVIGQTLCGWASDRFGRKNTLAVIMFIDAVLFVASGFCDDPHVLLAVRIAVGFAAPLAVSLAWVSDQSSPQRLSPNMAKASASFNVGVTIGAAVGGIVGHWKVACCLSGVIPLLNFLWLAPLKVVQGGAGTGGAVEGVARTLRTPEWLCLALASSGYGLFVGVYLTMIPLALKEQYGTEAWTIALMIMCCSLLQTPMAIFIVPRLTAFGIRRGGMQVPLCLCGLVSIGALTTLALLFEFHAPVWTIIVFTPIAYASTFSSLAQVNLGTTWCALRFGKNAVGSVTSAGRAVLGVAWAISPVACFAWYSAAPPSAAALSAMPAGAHGGRPSIPLAICTGWYVFFVAVLFGTLRSGHPVKPPNFNKPKPLPPEAEDGPRVAPPQPVAPHEALTVAPVAPEVAAPGAASPNAALTKVESESSF